ncbi:MAG: mechanosensitive ion channel family protein [Chitinophagaceae bacterium]
MNQANTYVSKRIILLLVILFMFQSAVYSQQPPPADSLQNDSLRRVAETMLIQQQQQQHIDSMIRIQLQEELKQSEGNARKTRELEEKLEEIAIKDSVRKAGQLQRITELKKNSTGYAVAPFNDTLFYIFTKTGSFSAAERAAAISQRIQNLYNEPFYRGDSLKINETENGVDILYNKEIIILSVTNLDALWMDKDGRQLANEYLTVIKKAIADERDANSFRNWVKRIALVLLIILGLSLLIFSINKIFKRITRFLVENEKKYFTGLKIRNIKIFTADQHQHFILRVNNVIRILVIILAVYLALPLLFSIFPETKTWTGTLLKWILTPAKSALWGILGFLPSLFTILVIYFIFRYAIKGLKYFAKEVERGHIQLSGFHPDWAQTTANIVKFLLYAFMMVLIFPYLPGSGSDIFKGVSVFIGVLFSLGSSSAISNMVAGLVITYMRPFKIGDRIKIGEITGDVIEKTMLVTRIRTIKNEDITVPNSTVLLSNTINYSSNTKPEDKGLIIHTTVTIGYDIPWKEMNQALVNAALRTEFVLKDPQPFVLQTSLDDFYVSYQVNAYTKEANNLATIYSQLHQNIQDCCNETGIEILSPHYRAMRDGNMSTIPSDYLKKEGKPSENEKKDQQRKE